MRPESSSKMTTIDPALSNGTNDKIEETKKRRINGRLVPIKIYYFLHEGGGAISPFVSLVAKRIGVSVGVLGIINTITVSLSLIAKPIIGGLIDKFGCHKAVWLFCHIITVSCIFSLIFIPTLDSNSDKESLSVNATGNCADKEANMQICINQTIMNNFVLCHAVCDQCNISSSFNLNYTLNQLNSTNCKSLSKVTQCQLICNNNSLSTPNLHTSYQFWWLSIANVAAGVTKRLVEVIQTSVVYGILAEKHSLFGKQKIFGSLGYAISFITGGILNQFLVTDSEGFQFNYSFYIFGVSMLLASIVICWFKVQPQSRPDRIVHDVGAVFTKPQNCFLFVSIFFLGTFVSFLSTYSFWYLSELGATPLILGLAKGCQALIGEIPCLFTSGWLIKKIGHFNVFALIFLIQTIGFCIYALMKNILFAFLTEILNGIIIGFFLPTATSYCTLVAPPGTATTLQGIFFAIFKGAGRMMGNLGGGFLYSAFGGRTTYLMFGVVSFICLLFNMTLNIVFQRRKAGSFNIT